MRISRACIAAVLVAACAPRYPRTAPAPREADPLVLADTGLTADSLASAVRRGCGGGYEARRACVERSLGRVLAVSGVARAMAVLDRIAEADEDLRREAHGLAHGLGIAAYRSPESVAATFAACPATQIAGCRHGVIQAYFLDVARRAGEVSGHDLDALCAPHHPNPDLFLQCAHGIGHGVMALNGHRLPAALETCDLIGDPTARTNCWGGAFMENIVAVTHPEHTAEAHAALASGHGSVDRAGPDHGRTNHGEMDHGGMDHGGMDHGAMAHADSAPAWKPLDPADPLYPCDAVAEKYQNSCYLIQTAAILAGNHGDIAATAATCATAPTAMVRTCHASLGRDVTSYAARDPARTAELCARAGAGELDCLRGAAAALFEVDRRPADALGLCRAVEGPERKTACYQAAARRIRASTLAAGAMGPVCAQAEAGYEEVCRAAAGLPRSAPAR